MELNTNELIDIKGGKNNWTIGVIIGVIGTLIAGIFDGYLRPLTCNK